MARHRSFFLALGLVDEPVSHQDLSLQGKVSDAFSQIQHWFQCCL